MTGEPLDSRQTFPNLALRGAAVEWLSAHTASSGGGHVGDSESNSLYSEASQSAEAWISSPTLVGIGHDADGQTPLTHSHAAQPAQVL